MPVMPSCCFCNKPVSYENGQIYLSLKVGHDPVAKMCTHHFTCRQANIAKIEAGEKVYRKLFDIMNIPRFALNS